MTERIDRYEPERELGRGGMGVVYVALDPRLGRRVALKVITPQYGQDPQFRARFEREMRIAIALEHPNIVPVYETGEADGAMFIAMRLVDGHDLGQALRAGGAFAAARAARLARQIGSALDAAHLKGLVHRDVKPANVLVAGAGEDEHAYLTDFGLTRDTASETGLTNTGQWVGTADYVSPEQLDGGLITARSDIYSMACLLFITLTARLPFEGNLARKLWAHTFEEFPSVGPGIAGHREVDAVLARGAAKDPADRYPSAGDLGRALAGALTQTRVEMAERSVATGAALSGIATATELGDEPTRRHEHRDVHRLQPRPAVPTPTFATPTRAPSDAGRRRGATVWLAPVGLLLVAALAAGYVLASQKSSTGSSSGTTTQARPPQTSPAATSSTRVVTSASVPAATGITYQPYSPASGSYDAQIPSGSGWHNAGEQAVNPRLFETVLRTPGGSQILIDATPVDRPLFSSVGRSNVTHSRYSSRYGAVDVYSFTGPPSFCTSGSCSDYQLTLSDHSGVAVLGGPTAAAREIAARIITSVVPHI